MKDRRSREWVRRLVVDLMLVEEEPSMFSPLRERRAAGWAIGTRFGNLTESAYVFAMV